MDFNSDECRVDSSGGSVEGVVLSLPFDNHVLSFHSIESLICYVFYILLTPAVSGDCTVVHVTLLT